jgi:hypothetical protein
MCRSVVCQAVGNNWEQPAGCIFIKDDEGIMFNQTLETT